MICVASFHVKCGDLMSADCKGLAGHLHTSSGSNDSSASKVSATGAKDKVSAVLKKGKRDSKKPQKTSSISSSIVVVN